MGDGCCLDSCLEEVAGFFIKVFIGIPLCIVLSAVITFGVYSIIDILILSLIKSKFLVITLYIIGYIIKAILTYRVFGGIISPSMGKSTNVNRIGYEYKYQSVFRTIISVIVALIYELGCSFFSMKYGLIADDPEYLFANTGNISAIRSDAMNIVIIVVLVATTIVTAVVRFRSIDGKAYRQSAEDKRREEYGE